MVVAAVDPFDCINCTCTVAFFVNVSSPSNSMMYEPAVAASASAAATIVSPDPPFSLIRIWLNAHDS